MNGMCVARITLALLVLTHRYGWLECDFVEQQRERVYALKWYLGLEEFYRWTPAETPSVKTFPVRGRPLVVDVAASRRGRVRILDVTLGATGVFRCEVSAEAPSFHTESAVATMTVVDLPDERPVLTGVQASYQLQEDVSVNCSSPRSQPPATLTFYINDIPADPSWLRWYPPLEEGNSGLETAVLGLVFPLRPRLLRRGPAIIKCTATILDRYWESSVAAVHSDVPHHASVMGGHASHATGCVDLTSWVLTRGMVVGWFLLHLLH